MNSAGDDRLARYLQVGDDLHQRILNGEWKPGDLIPSESFLSEEYEVALGTMRKAIQQLVKNGLLDRHQGIGTFVRRADFNKSLFRFFRFNDGERVIPESRILNIKVMKAPDEAARKLGLLDGDDVIWINRLRLIKCNPVLIEDIWLPLSKFQELIKLEPSEFPALLYPLYEQICGLAVTSASEELMVESIKAEHCQVLGLDMNAPVILIERIAIGIQDEILEWRLTRGSADKFRYQINIC